MEHVHRQPPRRIVSVPPNVYFSHFTRNNLEGFSLPRSSANPIFSQIVPLAYVPHMNILVPAPSPNFCPGHALFVNMDERRSNDLIQLMIQEGFIPSPEEERKRQRVIKRLKQTVTAWIKKIACKILIPINEVYETSATVLTYGSYGLGVHTSESDMDALCVGPYFVSDDNFFDDLHDMLRTIHEVSDIHCIRSAKVPIIKFRFDGVLVDLPYAKLNAVSVSEDVDILDPSFLRRVDEESWKRLSGVRVNKCILQMVPDVEGFRWALRCIKQWAKSRGIYGTLFGFLGGVHLAVLTALICQRHGSAPLNVLMAGFFATYSSWRWTDRPVRLQGCTAVPPHAPLGLMPIQLPCAPYDLCASNIVRSTFTKIQRELDRARSVMFSKLSWSCLFDPFRYSIYTHFLMITVSASSSPDLLIWCGLVKSRFPSLLLRVESAISFCDPNPTEHVSPDIPRFNTVFYWGLDCPDGAHDVRLLDIYSLRYHLYRTLGNDRPPESSGRADMAIIHASQLPESCAAACPPPHLR